MTRKEFILAAFDDRRECESLYPVIDELKRVRSLLENEIAVLRNELAYQKEKYTVCIGVERGLSDPLYTLQVRVHPMEFKYSRLGDGLTSVSALAHAIGQETGEKVAQALIDFVEGKPL